MRVVPDRKASRHIPVLIDFDFRFDASVTERRYDIDMIQKVIREYMIEMANYVELPEKAEVYLMEKSSPVLLEKKEHY